MESIASFQIDHTRLLPGMYISRKDGDVTTWDLRFIRPNTPPYLPQAAMHTLEHLYAVWLRNSEVADKVIYFGPMGCRTGFYLLLRSEDTEAAVSLVQRATAFCAAFEGNIPGATEVECGNAAEHDLPTARRYAAEYARVLKDWCPEDCYYLE